MLMTRIIMDLMSGPKDHTAMVTMGFQQIQGAY